MPASGPVVSGRDIAVFALQAPEDPLDGGDLRIWTLLGGGKATLVCLSRKARNANRDPLRNALPWQAVHQVQTREGTPVLPETAWTPGQWLDASPRFVADAKAGLRDFAAANPEMVWLAFPVLSGLLLTHLFPNCRPAIDVTDSTSLYFRRRFRRLPATRLMKRANSLWQAWRWIRLERQAAERASAIFTAGEADKKFLGEQVNAAVCCYGSATPWVSQPALPKALPASPRRIGFFGGMTWEPNRETARYLAKELLPALLRRNADCELQIVGSAVDQHLADLGQDEGVSLRGFVPDVREWLSTCEIFVMPMFQGAGVKSKLLEAMASGAAIVTNTVGAEALPGDARDAVVVADGTTALANAIIDLLDRPARRQGLERRAREAAQRHFDPAVVAAQYRSAVLGSTAPWMVGT